MSKLVWDKIEERFFETGTDRGVLYMQENGNYNNGVAWNGLTGVTESPSGAEPSKQYADNIAYVTLMSAEEFAGTIEAFTCPDEFFQFDGIVTTPSGMKIGQQKRPDFGFAYRTKKGSAADEDLGYKLHLVYGAKASPSEKAYKTVNDSPEPLTFSWAFTTTPVNVTGFRPTSIVTIDSTDPRVSASALQNLEDILYGTDDGGGGGNDPRLPLPDEVNTILEAGIQLVTPTAPSYNAATDTITIPATTGVVYSINGDDKDPNEAVVITEDTVVRARPAAGYSFTGTYVNQWYIAFT
jgi:hypothetical protein